MRIAVVVALGIAAAGCVSSATQYGASLSQQDPKWGTQACQQARADAVSYDQRAQSHPGWAAGVVLGPYSMGLVAAGKEHDWQQRRLLARQIHLQCSSQPLPKDLDFDPKIYAPKATQYP